MHHHILYRKLGSWLFIVLLPVLFAGCGFSFGSGSSTSSTTVVLACPTPLPIQTVQGTIQSMSGTTLVIAGSNGTTSKALYTSTTRFTLQSKAALSALQKGAFVTVTANQAANKTYTATTISLSTNRATGAGGGFGGFGGQGSGANSSCVTPGRRPGAGNRPIGSGNGANGATRVIGTVTQIVGNTLTVTRTGTRFAATPTTTTTTTVTIEVGSATQILQTTQTSASALKVGVRINLVGVSNGQGGITAQSITVLAS